MGLLAACVAARPAHATTAVTDVQVVPAVRVPLRTVGAPSLRQSLAFGLPTLGHHVRLVVCVGADEDVIGADTLGIVAVVAEEHAFGNRADHALIDDTVCERPLLFAIRQRLDEHEAVATVADLAAVLPAALTDERLVQRPDVSGCPLSERRHQAADPGRTDGQASEVMKQRRIYMTSPEMDDRITLISPLTTTTSAGTAELAD